MVSRLTSESQEEWSEQCCLIHNMSDYDAHFVDLSSLLIKHRIFTFAFSFFFFSSRRRHTRSDRDWSSDVCFFFSSRRRHTRSDRDWSSDVCSSDRSEEHTSELQSQAEDGIRDLIVTGVQTCALPIDRKSTRLNSSHDQISYAVFC